MARKGRRQHGDVARRPIGGDISWERLQAELSEQQGSADARRSSLPANKPNSIALGRLIDVEPFQPVIETLRRAANAKNFRIRKWIAVAALHYASAQEIRELSPSVGGEQGLADLLVALQASDERLAGTTEIHSVAPKYDSFRLGTASHADRTHSRLRAEIFVPNAMLEEAAIVRDALGLPKRRISDSVQVPLAKVSSAYDQTIPAMILEAQGAMPPAATFMPVAVFDMPAYRAPGR